MLSSTLKFANLSLVALTLLAYLAPLVNPNAFWPLSFLGLAFPALLFAHLAFILWWVLRRHAYVFFSLACLLVGGEHWGALLRWPAKPLPPTEKSFRVVSFNMGKILMGSPEQLDRQKKRLRELFLQLGEVDILCAQECNEYMAGTLLEQEGFPHHHRFRGTAVFSRLPILGAGDIPFENSVNSAHWVDVAIQGQRVRVFNVHLQSSRISYFTWKLSKNHDLQNPETWKGLRGILARYRATARMRARQAARLRQAVKDSPYPVLLCGDFNEPPNTYTYRLLSRGLQDSFRLRGGGWGSTYAGVFPFLRIDYILADTSFRVLRHRVLRRPLADHYPVIADLEFR